MAHFQLFNFRLILLLRLGQHTVPVLIELLVLLDVRLLNLLLSLLMSEDHLLVVHLKLLLLQLSDAVLSHFRLYTTIG